MRNENPVIMFARVRTTVKVIRQIEIHSHSHTVNRSSEKKRRRRTTLKFSHMSSTSAFCLLPRNERKWDTKTLYAWFVLGYEANSILIKIENTQSHPQSTHRHIQSIRYSYSQTILHNVIWKIISVWVNAKQAVFTPKIACAYSCDLNYDFGRNTRKNFEREKERKSER